MIAGLFKIKCLRWSYDECNIGTAQNLLRCDVHPLVAYSLPHGDYACISYGTIITLGVG